MNKLSSSVKACVLVTLCWLATISSVCAETTANSEPFVRLEAELPSGYAPLESSTEAGLWQVCDSLTQGIASSPARLRNNGIEDYLHGIACRLEPEYCDEISIYLIRNPYFNASMMPNGVMQVWTGLLARVKSEAELAAVIGHELGHYLRRHSVKGREDLILKNNILTFLGLGLSAGIATGSVNPDLASAGFDLTQLALVASYFAYNRDHERESDHFGIQLMADAGYETQAASSVWNSLIEEQELSKLPQPPYSFTATHPQSEERRRTLAMKSHQLSLENRIDGESYRERYIENIAPILELMLEDEVDHNEPARAIYVISSLKEAGFSPSMTSFFLADAYRRRGEEGDQLLAIDHLEAAANSSKPYPQAYKWLGILHLKKKNKAAARKYFEEHLAEFPDSEDREMVLYYLSLTEEQ